VDFARPLPALGHTSQPADYFPQENLGNGLKDGVWMISGFKFFTWKQLNLAFITKFYVTSGTSSNSMTITGHIS